MGEKPVSTLFLLLNFKSLKQRLSCVLCCLSRILENVELAFT